MSIEDIDYLYKNSLKDNVIIFVDSYFSNFSSKQNHFK